MQSLERGTRPRLGFLPYNYQLHSFVSVQGFLSLRFLFCSVSIVCTLPIGFWKDANKTRHYWAQATVCFRHSYLFIFFNKHVLELPFCLTH